MNKYFPQDEALKLAKLFPECDKLVRIANNMCCASTALWFMGVDEKKHLEIIAEEYGKSLLNRDGAYCLVWWDEFFKKVSGRSVTVEFVKEKIKTLNDLKKYGKQKLLAKYENAGHEHWIGIENCKIVYNSIQKSECVNKGKITELRVISFK